MTVKHPIQRFVENDLHSNLTEVAGKLKSYKEQDIERWISDNKLLDDFPLDFIKSLIGLKSDQTYSRTYSNILGYQVAWLKGRDAYSGISKKKTENDYLSNEFHATILDQVREDPRIKKLIEQERAEKKSNGAISCIIEIDGHATFKYTFYNLEVDPHLKYEDDKGYISYFDHHQCMPFPKVNNAEYDKLSRDDKIDELYEDEDNFYCRTIVAEKEYDVVKLLMDIIGKNMCNERISDNAEDAKYHLVQHGFDEE